jgi:hypothetical protein
MSEFMEVFTVTHMTYLCVFPCVVALIGIVLAASGQILSFNADNLFLFAFLAIVLVMLSGKAFDTMSEAPYFEARMIQFDGRDDKMPDDNGIR